MQLSEDDTCKWKAVSESVGDAVLAPGVDLGDDQDVVEEEHLSLMLTQRNNS